MSGQHTHGQASVTSYNTADFTKLSLTQNDILSNQKSSKGGLPPMSSGTETDQNANAVAMAMKKL